MSRPRNGSTRSVKSKNSIRNSSSPVTAGPRPRRSRRSSSPAITFDICGARWPRPSKAGPISTRPMIRPTGRNTGTCRRLRITTAEMPTESIWNWSNRSSKLINLDPGKRRGTDMADYVVEFGKDGGRIEPHRRLDAPAFHRNHQAIRTVLEKFLDGKSRDAVEAGSGTGQHAVDFAHHFPEIMWWPSDFNEQHLRSIAAWRAHAGLANVRPPLRIDLSDPAWCPQIHDGTGPAHALSA